MVAIVLPTDTPPHPSRLWGSKGQIQRFSEHGHVAYQIEGSLESSNMVANILRIDTHPNYPWVLSECQSSISLEHGHGAYHIKGNRECINEVASILPTDSPLNPATLGMGLKGQSSTFSEHCNDACQKKRM